MTATITAGDCRQLLPGLAAASVHAVITDPPYELAFMGKRWDASGVAYDPAVWAECLRVLTPGGHLLAFGGTRTYHRMVCAVEDAGFEIRDSIQWVYGSGFPKSRDVGKALDQAAGADRSVVAPAPYTRGRAHGRYSETRRVSYDYPPQPVTAPATEAAQRWHGWGTALKPAHEPIVVARKPLAGTVAATVAAYGTGALNIAGTRVAHATAADLAAHQASVAATKAKGGVRNNSWKNSSDLSGANDVHPGGRWPPNLVLTHDPDCTERAGCVACCPVAELDAQSGVSRSVIGRPRGAAAGPGWGMTATGAEYADDGGASRFFPVFRYSPKAGRRERPQVEGVPPHPTVKPLALMRWLVRLVTPPGGLVLDPFAGTGPTLEAAVLEGCRGLGFEADPGAVRQARKRLATAGQRPAPKKPPVRRRPARLPWPAEQEHFLDVLGLASA